MQFFLDYQIKQIKFCFLEQTGIILSSETKVVTYIDKKGERTTFLLSSLDLDNKELTKRIKYTKDMLMDLLNKKFIKRK